MLNVNKNLKIILIDYAFEHLIDSFVCILYVYENIMIHESCENEFIREDNKFDIFIVESLWYMIRKKNK